MVIDRLQVPMQPPYAVGSTPSGGLLKSSDPSIVEIDSAGNLIGHRSVEVVVRGSGAAALRVVVQTVRKLEIVPQSVEIALGKKYDVEVLGDGRRLAPEVIRWETSNPNIAAAFGSTVQAGMVPGT